MDILKEGIKLKRFSRKEIFQSAKLPRFQYKRTLEWMGGVNQETLNRITGEIKRLVGENHEEPINLIVNSHGGPTGIGMTFFDLVRKFFRANLHTIGTGDVDSSGIIVFLAGNKRSLMANTTLLFHMAGRYFDGARRITTSDMRAMLKEDTLKDHQYASVVAHQSGGRLTQTQVLEMMKTNTVLSPSEAIELGLAHEILS